MTNIIDNYKTLLQEVPKLLEISGYKNEYVAKKLNMTPTHFSSKKLKGSWTVDEVEKDELSYCPNEFQVHFRKIYQ